MAPMSLDNNNYVVSQIPVEDPKLVSPYIKYKSVQQNVFHLFYLFFYFVSTDENVLFS